MRTTKIGGVLAAVLSAGGLVVASPEVAAASPPLAGRCVSGVYRVQVQLRHLPFQVLYTVKSTWLPFPTTCATRGAGSPPA